MGKWVADVAAITVGVVLAELAIRCLHQYGVFPPLQ